MPPEVQEQQPKQRASFQLIKTTRLDKKGRFYLPESVVANIFAGVQDGDREVDVYLGTGGRILLVPVAE